MRLATAEEIECWDELVAANPDGGNPLQGKAFAETKQEHGWVPRYIIHELSKAPVAAMYLTRRVSGFGQLWYCPQGPGVADLTQLKAIVKDLEKQPAFLIKLEPLLPQDLASKMGGLGLVKPPRQVQYNSHTIVVDLTPEPETILASFRQKTRYNVRLAERKGVTVEAVPTTLESMDQMYALMSATQGRAGFYLRDQAYFNDFWSRHAESGAGQQFFAYADGKILAGAYVVYLGQYGLYKDGGSIREQTELQAPYALQWGAMEWLKQHGVTKYDMHGTPPADQIDDPKHPLAGLARFKTGFCSEVTEYLGAWDLAVQPTKYKLWRRAGERAAMALEQRLRHRLFY
jgi:lipid II:glycine glycyltransferase (peptidoglycan interpeptide bridge formation enzyme)